MSNPSDFVITIHALNRMEERFPILTSGMTDEEQGALIHKDVSEALDAGRHSRVPPIELAPSGIERWEMRQPGAYVCWIEGKTRGYVVKEDPDEGLMVLTILVGQPLSRASRKIRKGRRR